MGGFQPDSSLGAGDESWITTTKRRSTTGALRYSFDGSKWSIGPGRHGWDGHTRPNWECYVNHGDRGDDDSCVISLAVTDQLSDTLVTAPNGQLVPGGMVGTAPPAQTRNVTSTTETGETMIVCCFFDCE